MLREARGTSMTVCWKTLGRLPDVCDSEPPLVVVGSGASHATSLDVSGDDKAPFSTSMFSFSFQHCISFDTRSRLSRSLSSSRVSMLETSMRKSRGLVCSWGRKPSCAKYERQDVVCPEYTTEPWDMSRIREKRENASERGWWRESIIVRPRLARRSRVSSN